MQHVWKITWLLIELLAAIATAAEELPTPVEARLHTIAAPRVIHAGRYIYAPSPVTGSAIFAATYLPPSKPASAAPREGDFKIDRNLPDELRARDADYRGSPYAKGHLIPWGHFSNLADAQATLNYSNAAPQSPNMNSGIWGQNIEPAVRALRDETHGVFDITILIYEFRRQVPRWIGPGHIFVPTHFAKAAIQVDGDQVTAIRSWMVPNEAVAPGPDKFRTTLAMIEAKSQLELCPWLDEETERRLENAE